MQIKDREKKKEKIVQKKSNHPIKMGGRRKAAVDPESRIAPPERDRESLEKMTGRFLWS